MNYCSAWCVPAQPEEEAVEAGGGRGAGAGAGAGGGAEAGGTLSAMAVLVACNAGGETAQSVSHSVAHFRSFETRRELTPDSCMFFDRDSRG